ncbi:MAG: YhjD/YihY/BrkB family envelope integrity protein [Actinocatenispora sp.]
MARRATPDDAAVGERVPVVEMSRTYKSSLQAGVRAGLQVSGRTLSKAWHDRILGMSAESAFWQLLSLPSALIALLGALGYAARWLGPGAVSQIRDWALTHAGQALNPRIVEQVVAPVVSQVLDQNRTDVIGIGTIIALWSGSSATATFVNTITIAYGQRDLRGAVASRIVALRLYLFTVLAGVIVLPAVVFGPGALDRVFSGGWHEFIAGLVHALYWPVLGIVVFAGISTFYHLATPVRLRWRRAFPGAAVALILFMALSYGLQVYVLAIATNLRVYSTLAAPILTLMYFYALAFAVLLGAEFNAALEERWPRGTRQSASEWLRDHAQRVRHRHSGENGTGRGHDRTKGGESASGPAQAPPGTADQPGNGRVDDGGPTDGAPGGEVRTNGRRRAREKRGTGPGEGGDPETGGEPSNGRGPDRTAPPVNPRHTPDRTSDVHDARR